MSFLNHPGSGAEIFENLLFVENHFHTREHWRGKKAVQGATDWFDDVLTPFRAISGNGVYGADADDEAKVVGSGDTPIEAGYTTFDLHRFCICSISDNGIYKLRIVWGTGTMADAIAAEQFSENMIKPNETIGNKWNGGPIDIKMPALPVGMKIWIQTANVVDNATIDFQVGLHEYNHT